MLQVFILSLINWEFGLILYIEIDSQLFTPTIIHSFTLSQHAFHSVFPHSSFCELIINFCFLKTEKMTICGRKLRGCDFVYFFKKAFS